MIRCDSTKHRLSDQALSTCDSTKHREALKHLRFNQALSPLNPENRKPKTENAGVSPPPPSPRHGWWLAAVVFGIVGLQIVGVGGSRKRAKPGPARGDMVLTQEALPAKIGDWKQRSFTPAPPPEQLPKGQFWWVHQWQYGDNKNSAIVSCDQLGEDDWHELTICYRGLGWTIHNRTEYQGNDSDGGPYVVAELRKDSGDAALLVFSVFYEDGTWSAPPAVDLSHLNQKQRVPGFFAKTRERVDPIVTFGDSSGRHTRAIQCQVLVTNFRTDIPSELDSAIQLHLQTRQHFRSEWLSRRSTLATRD